MKRLAFALCLTLAGPLAFAQSPQAPADTQQPPAPITRSQPDAQSGHPRGFHHRQPDPHRQAIMLSHRLNLTPDQTAKIEPVLADRQQKIDALRANSSLTPDQIREQMRSLHEQERSQFAAILTPEQQEQLKSMRRGHGRGSRSPQPAGA